ncbi:MAG: phosphoglucomutase/phosphomannomutase family protein [Bacteroidia bacterium]|nr:phosphoglucomutase/phosphomannomutase family protein [Bacteroidia bacterium]MDW8015590.1 phosphoglucomutase/phosphomannomutase family protein [Bacteroidia bacterium]
MKPIRFGTDGWRAIIAKDFTFDNLSRVVEATGRWLLQRYDEPKVMIGYDCRFLADKFAEATAQQLAQSGIKVYLSPTFATTPMVSFATMQHQCHLGVVLTASHNPPEYAGYKLKASYGGPAPLSLIQEIEALIPPTPIEVIDQWEKLIHSRQLEMYDMEALYHNYIKSRFNLGALSRLPYRIGFDAMYGAGQRIFPRILPSVQRFRCEYNPSFGGIHPEPIPRNLGDFARFMQEKDLDIGFILDGDADRIGMLGRGGRYIDAHHIILLVLHYLVRYQSKQGRVILSLSCATRVGEYARRHGLAVEITPVGFKHIAERMQASPDTLLGAEESGGIAIPSHLPERDGTFVALTLLQMLLETGKSIEELIAEVYEVVGPFSVDRLDWHLPEAQKQAALRRLSEAPPTTFAGKPVIQIDRTDGFKLILDGGEAIMFRASGTEPILRIYTEAETATRAEALLTKGQEWVMEA